MKQRIYTTEEQILKEMDRCTRMALGWQESADELEQLISDSKKSLAKLEDGSVEAAKIAERIPVWRLQLTQANRNANRWSHRLHVTMKDVLARFRTMPMLDKENLSVVEK